MIKRAFLAQVIKNEQLNTAATPAAVIEGQEVQNSYALGHHLGYQDGLAKVLQLLEVLPSEEPPIIQRAQKSWHSGR